jgi:hypothetical protein
VRHPDQSTNLYAALTLFDPGRHLNACVFFPPVCVCGPHACRFSTQCCTTAAVQALQAWWLMWGRTLDGSVCWRPSWVAGTLPYLEQHSLGRRMQNMFISTFTCTLNGLASCPAASGLLRVERAFHGLQSLYCCCIMQMELLQLCSYQQVN